MVRRQCANRWHGPDRHISDNRWRLPCSLETRSERVVMDHSWLCVCVGGGGSVGFSVFVVTCMRKVHHLFLLMLGLFTTSCCFLLLLIPLPFFVYGLSFKMHSNLPKSIEVLLVCIIDTKDHWDQSHAILCNLKFFLYLNVFFKWWYATLLYFCLMWRKGYSQ